MPVAYIESVLPFCEHKDRHIRVLNTRGVALKKFLSVVVMKCRHRLCHCSNSRHYARCRRDSRPAHNCSLCMETSPFSLPGVYSAQAFNPEGG